MEHHQISGMGLHNQNPVVILVVTKQEVLLNHLTLTNVWNETNARNFCWNYDPRNFCRRNFFLRNYFPRNYFQRNFFPRNFFQMNLSLMDLLPLNHERKIDLHGWKVVFLGRKVVFLSWKVDFRFDFLFPLTQNFPHQQICYPSIHSPRQLYSVL